MKAAHLMGLAVAVVVVGSLWGAGQAAGTLALLLLLPGILLFAVRGGRPVIGGAPHSAHSFGYLARYAIPLDGLPEIVIGAFAGLAMVTYLLPDATTGALVASYVLVFALYVLPSAAADSVLGIGGVVFTLLTLWSNDGCTPPISQQDEVWLVGLLVLVLGVHLARRVGILRLGRRLADGLSPGGSMLVAFGVLDLMLFVVRPNGLEIWDGAPGWARPLAIAFLAVIALAGSYAPGPVVLGLVALAVAMGQAVLVAVELQLVAAQPIPVADPCRTPLADALWMVGFVLVAGVARSVRSGGSR